MTIKAKVNNTLVDITEVITKVGGVLVRQSPLQAKINGVLVDFIVYGYNVTALINLTPDVFDASKLSTTINYLGKTMNVCVKFSSGDFLCTTPIKITVSNVTLKGSKKTTLKCNGDYSSSGIIDVRGTSTNILNNIIIDGLCIDGNYTSGSTAYRSVGVYCTYVGVAKVNTTATAYDSTIYGNAQVNKTGISITNCNIYGTSGYMIYLLYTHNNIISNNNLAKSNSGGIYCNTSNFTNIINNIIKNSQAIGIYYTTGSNNIISNNYILNNNSNGVNLNSINNSTISNNLIKNHNGTGMYLGSCNNNMFSGNIVQGQSTTGMQLASCNYNTITANNIRYNTNFGIYASTSVGNIITGNVVVNNLASGDIYFMNDVTSTYIVGNRTTSINLGTGSDNTSLSNI